MEKTLASGISILVIVMPRKRSIRRSNKSIRPQKQINRGDKDNKIKKVAHAAGVKLDKHFDEDKVEGYR